MKDEKEVNHLKKAGKKLIIGLLVAISIFLISAVVIKAISWNENRIVSDGSETLASAMVTPINQASTITSAPPAIITTAPPTIVTETPLSNSSPTEKPIEHLNLYDNFRWINESNIFNGFIISEKLVDDELYYRLYNETRDIEILVDRSERNATLNYHGKSMNFDMQFLGAASSSVSFDFLDVTGDGEDELIICHSWGGTGCFAGTCDVINLTELTIYKIDDYIDDLCSKMKVEPIKVIHGGQILCKVTASNGNVCYGTINAAYGDNINDYSFKPENYANYYSIGINYEKHCLQISIGIDMDNYGNLYLGNITSYMVYDKSTNSFLLTDEYSVTMFYPAEGYYYDSSTSETVETQKEKVIDNIIAINDRYINYGVETYQEDYNGDGQQEFFYLFIYPDTFNEGIYNYKVDIWFASIDGVRKIAESELVDPNTYGSIEVAGRKYFRYDNIYITGSITHILEVRNNQCSEYFTACGPINFVKDSNEFTITYDCYDMFYDKQDRYYRGRTWKNYYYYADDKGFHEYGAKEISKEEFLEFRNAENILKDINMKYGNVTKLNLQFLKRSNGLIHINISAGDDERISY